MQLIFGHADGKIADVKALQAAVLNFWWRDFNYMEGRDLKSTNPALSIRYHEAHPIMEIVRAGIADRRGWLVRHIQRTVGAQTDRRIECSDIPDSQLSAIIDATYVDSLCWRMECALANRPFPTVLGVSGINVQVMNEAEYQPAQKMTRFLLEVLGAPKHITLTVRLANRVFGPELKRLRQEQVIW